MMTQDSMNALVSEKLREIERECGVKVLYSAETGSRAWGLATPDSDFDVRFIYIRPRNDYLRLDEPRDVIETPVDDTWDVSGWDLQKALRLLWKSNPSLFEWVSSQIRYADAGFAGRMEPLLREYFGQKAMAYHYYHMAGNNIRAFLQGETVRPKKYFYALRPVLSCFWILENNTWPPILYADLAEALLPAPLRAANAELLDIRVNHPERAEIAPMPRIDAYIRESMEALEQRLRGLPDYRPKGWEPLNRFFLSELDRMEGGLQAP